MQKAYTDTMEYSVQIDITIFTESVNINDIASSLPVHPDLISARGSRNLEKMIPRRSSFSFRSKAASWEAGVDEHWASLSDMVKHNGKKLVDISRNAHTKITIIVEHKGRFPSLCLPKEMVIFAASIGAVIDIDVYEENMDLL